jgi:hypothetical protein
VAAGHEHLAAVLLEIATIKAEVADQQPELGL